MSKSELEKAKAKLKATIAGIFGLAFLLGLSHQLIVPLFYAAGIFSGIFLLRFSIDRWFRR
jgi:hypothetical protein